MKLVETLEIALRDRTRRLILEALGRNIMHNKQLIAQLGMMDARREVEEWMRKVQDDFPLSETLAPQAEAVKASSNWDDDHYPLGKQVAAFRREYCGTYAEPSPPIKMPRGVVEDDAGFDLDTLPGQWSKPVEVKA